ncbi:P-loop containing nucleoside triphosphate hydrolase protein [Dunaliella salina]|uniref:P-loop containing nucleoside triphosphate hydrolase protein n=1 Tax=Dunaliella salina TaxID=3046 RepID=A0ABQ7GT24_DUNSA|nr:P-loop containing nucleoside triphosphate hydrolase protein [Dunaliella salina]|eukprot:KAF5837762.1 P-loop containing nucleoside triphosphate hydrolase protein [Dunaliella salina]
MPKGKRIILINYEAVDKRPDLEEAAWDCIFCDEGHALSNKMNGYRRLMRLQARIRVLISGTPIQSHLEQFYNLLNLCNPGLAGTEKDFKRDVIQPIRQGISAQARRIGLSRENEEEALQDEVLLKDAMAKYLRDFLKPYFKRCVKTEEDLPPLRQYIVHVQLSPAQMSAYHQQLARGQDMNHQEAISKLQKICWQPALALQSDQLLDQHQASSAKLQVALELLEKFAAAGEKTIVFSTWLEPLDLLKQGLRRKGFAEDRDYVSVEGSVKDTDRPKLLDDFQDLSSSVSFLFMTKQVGKEGLNLTAATNVVILDPSLNPTVDEQAASRAHRIGQTKPVCVYRFACAGTIEEVHSWVQELKTLIARMLLAPESHSVVFSSEKYKLSWPNIVEAAEHMDFSVANVYLKSKHPTQMDLDNDDVPEDVRELSRHPSVVGITFLSDLNKMASTSSFSDEELQRVIEERLQQDRLQQVQLQAVPPTPPPEPEVQQEGLLQPLGPDIQPEEPLLAPELHLEEIQEQQQQEEQQQQHEEEEHEAEAGRQQQGVLHQKQQDDQEQQHQQHDEGENQGSGQQQQNEQHQKQRDDQQQQHDEGGHQDGSGQQQQNEEHQEGQGDQAHGKEEEQQQQQQQQREEQQEGDSKQPQREDQQIHQGLLLTFWQSILRRLWEVTFLVWISYVWLPKPPPSSHPASSDQAHAACINALA